MSVHVRSSGVAAIYRNSGWEIGVINAAALRVGGQQVVGARAAAIAGPAGGTSVDAQCREAVQLILETMRQHGLIAT